MRRRHYLVERDGELYPEISLVREDDDDRYEEYALKRDEARDQIALAVKKGGAE